MALCFSRRRRGRLILTWNTGPARTLDTGPAGTLDSYLEHWPAFLAEPRERCGRPLLAEFQEVAQEESGGAGACMMKMHNAVIDVRALHYSDHAAVHSIPPIAACCMIS